jgi:hypothetical protein
MNPYNNLRTVLPNLSEEGFELLNLLLAYNPERRVTALEAEVSVCKSRIHAPIHVCIYIYLMSTHIYITCSQIHPYFALSPYPCNPRLMPTFPSSHKNLPGDELESPKQVSRERGSGALPRGGSKDGITSRSKESEAGSKDVSTSRRKESEARVRTEVHVGGGSRARKEGDGFKRGCSGGREGAGQSGAEEAGERAATCTNSTAPSVANASCNRISVNCAARTNETAPTTTQTQIQVRAEYADKVIDKSMEDREREREREWDKDESMQRMKKRKT